MCVQVTLTPYATSRNAIARCCGNPVVTEQNSCPRGERTCTFTVTQPLCIEVSIEFGADISTGDASVICGGVSEEGCECNSDNSETSVNDEYNIVRKNRFFNR